MKVYVDGVLVEEEDAKISVFDHGLLYGDGVFEGIRAYNGRVFKLREHVNRLYNSAKVIMLEMPLTKEKLCEAIITTLRENALKDAYIRVVVTRGVGDLGLDPRKCKKPTVIIITSHINIFSKQFYEDGLEVITVPTRRNIPEALNPRIKSLNYLNNIMAKIESNVAGYLEAFMMNEYGYLCEGTGDNVFIVKNGKLITPPTWVGALEGVTRSVIIELAKENNIECMEYPLTRYDIFLADECFLVGTAIEIIGVTKVDGRTIGDGKIGKITKLMMDSFRRLTQMEGVAYL